MPLHRFLKSMWQYVWHDGYLLPYRNCMHQLGLAFIGA